MLFRLVISAGCISQNTKHETFFLIHMSHGVQGMTFLWTWRSSSLNGVSLSRHGQLLVFIVYFLVFFSPLMFLFFFLRLLLIRSSNAWRRRRTVKPGLTTPGRRENVSLIWEFSLYCHCIQTNIVAGRNLNITTDLHWIPTCKTRGALSTRPLYVSWNGSW
jgi:hypothetical protein